MYFIRKWRKSLRASESNDHSAHISDGDESEVKRLTEIVEKGYNTRRKTKFQEERRGMRGRNDGWRIGESKQKECTEEDMRLVKLIEMVNQKYEENRIRRKEEKRRNIKKEEKRMREKEGKRRVKETERKGKEEEDETRRKEKSIERKM